MPRRLDAVDESLRIARRRRSTQVENKREDLARDAARLERLEKKMADHEQLRDSEDADVTEEQRADARNYVATNSGVLDDKRADFHRRKESLEKLEKQLADYQALLEEEDREATERLESARASCPPDEVVGGFCCDSEAVRTASRDCPESRPNSLKIRR